MRLSLSALLVGALALSCSRPVDRPAGGSTFITDVQVTPEFVRQGAPIEIGFVSNGLPPASVTYDIAGQDFECEPEVLSAGRMRCVNPGLPADFPQGVTLVRVDATGEDGAVSSASGSLHVDFECPRFISATLSQSIAEPGDTVIVNIEASEVLGGPPRVTRVGRSWGVAAGGGVSWSLAREISAADPAQFAPVVIQIEDRAGNTSSDCQIDASLPFAVDQEAPVASVSGVRLIRDVPGQPAVLEADPGSFIDDVGIERVRVLDETGTSQLASIEVGDDGAIASQSVGATGTRVLVQAVDRFGRESVPQAVTERWRVSVGSGSTPGAAVKTAVRFTPAPPATASMRDRTVEIAPDIRDEDARSSVIRASIGFEKVGELPSRYENSKRSIAGYDPAGRAVVAVGGYNGPDLDDFRFFDFHMTDTLVLRWDEREGEYITEQGPLLSFLDDAVPYPRWGVNIAFDGKGCGVMFGDVVRNEELDISPGDALWQICGTPGGYVWTRIPLPPEVDGNCIANNLSPIVWDPFNERYIMAGGGASSCGDTRVLFLEPGETIDDWRWINVQPLPTNFGGRFNNLLYVDHGHRGFAVGLGGVNPIGNGEQSLYWTYRNGQWTTSVIPRALQFRSRFGWGYDTARRHLTVWGGSSDFRFVADSEVWYLTDTSTNGQDAWRETLLDHPVARDYPVMVYDSDREVMVVFQGVRSQDSRPVPQDVFQIISQPSFPYLQATADLGAARPKGIERLVMRVRAMGSGDLDGVRDGSARGGGVRVMLWDHSAERWDEVHSAPRDPQAGMETIEVTVGDNPERYVGPNGTIPVTVAPLHPATEILEGRLEVDLVDGYVDLRSGVSLP